MKTSYFYTIIITLFTSVVVAQPWTPVGTGIKMEEISEDKLKENPRVMNDGDGEKSNGTVYALITYKNELYAGGSFKIAGGKSVNNIARWNGTDWNPVGEGIDGNVTSFCIYNDELHVGGAFSKAGAVSASNIAKWNGKEWSAVGSGTDSDIQALTVSKGELYAGGDFTTAGGVPARHVAKWNGSTWFALGHGLHNDIYSLVEFNGEVYAGGSFVVKDAEVVHNLFKWNGKRWSGEGDFDGQVAALAVYGNRIYAGGHFGKVNDEQLSFVAVQDGKVWHPVGTGIGAHTPQHNVSALLSTEKELYACGYFKTYINNDHREANNIVRWTGDQWGILEKGVIGSAYAMAVYQGQLYVAGGFSMAGGVPVNNIARWKLMP